MSRISTKELINKIPLKEEVESIDIVVSFLKHSGLKSLYAWFDYWKDNNIPVRIVTSTYLSLTEPAALYELNHYFPGNVRIYNGNAPSFHPKAYFFKMKNKLDSHVFIGSSNMSEPGLVDGVEWNYRIDYSIDAQSYEELTIEFENIYKEQCIMATDEVIDKYSKLYSENKHMQSIMNKHYSSIIASNKVDGSPTIIPNGAQLEALYKLRKTREEGFDKALIVLATGVGKTFLSAFDSYSNQFRKILFVAHRKEILIQSEKTYKNIHTLKSSSFIGDGEFNLSGDMVFASVFSLSSKVKEIDPNHFDYIVIDEVHHAAAKSYEKVLKHFTPKFFLGLTATPHRLDGQDILQLFDYNLIHEVNIFEAINRDLLVPIDYRGIYDDTVKYELIHYRNGKYDEEDLSLKLMVEDRADLIFKHYSKHNIHKTLAFCSSLKHANYMADYFNNKDVKSVVVGSDSSLEHHMDRFEAIQSLANDSSSDNVKVIFSVDIFNEGLDLPQIDSILLLRPTESPVVFTQQIGRGLRKHNLKKKCLVLDFIGNYKRLDQIPRLLNIPIERFGSISKAMENYEPPLLSNIEFEMNVINIMDSYLKNTLKLEIKVDELIKELYRKYRKDKPLTRVEFFTNLSIDEYILIKKYSKHNPFKDYLKFLLTVETNIETNISGHELEFINELENTPMTRLYKIPVLESLVESGRLKSSVALAEIQYNFKEFYSSPINHLDIANQKNRTDAITISNKQARLILSNPINYLTQDSKFLKYDKSFNELVLILDQDSFSNIHLVQQLIDVLEFRRMEYHAIRLSS
jgi:superfamily II DNA or RNA helicase/HKD family nuclease